MWECILEALIDTVKLVPFLFVTYLAMEFLEHKAGEKTEEAVKKAGKFGPFFGGVLGILPQCGFSTAASNLYASRVITLGTLMAIYLSTSDEMLPILISERAPLGKILGILLTKLVIGALAGFVIDAVMHLCKKEEEHTHIHDICEHEHCHCEESILKSSVVHTLQIAGFILEISILLEVIFYFVGEEALGNFVASVPGLAPLFSALVGLIPNCAGSVVITQLYLQNVIGLGSAIGGLLTGTGVGLLVLFRVNHHRKENFMILGLLYGIGAVAGIVLELLL